MKMQIFTDREKQMDVVLQILIKEYHKRKEINIF